MVRVRRGQTVVACVALAAFALATLVAWAAAWHRGDVLETFPADRWPDDSGTLVRADIWFDNTIGVRNALLVAAAVLGIAWLYRMRDLADGLWPHGQRRHRAWLLLGWWLPIGNAFIPKMIVNDLWAATEPGRRRGNLLLGSWWLACLVTFGNSGATFRHRPQVTHLHQAIDQTTSAEQVDAFLLLTALLSLTVVWQLSGRLERAVGRRGA